MVFDGCSTSNEFLYCECSVFACLAYVFVRKEYVASFSEQLTPVSELFSHWAGRSGAPELVVHESEKKHLFYKQESNCGPQILNPLTLLAELFTITHFLRQKSIDTTKIETF